MQDKKEIMDLLRKHFQKSNLIETEEKKLILWKEENQESYQIYQRIWNEAPNLRINRSVDVEEQYQRFIGSSNKPQKFYRYSAAAVILIIISFAIYFYTLSGRQVLNNNTSGYQAYTLEDGTKVWLNENSRLILPGGFNQKERKVSLSGEAYFEVDHDQTKPFRVLNKHSTIEVVGTHFNVITSDSLDEVYLLEGKVSVSKNMQYVLLNPGEKALITSSKSITTSAFTDDNFLAWKTGKLSFENQTLGEISQTLEKHFHTTFQIANENTSHCKLTIAFDRLSLEDIMEELSFLLTIDFEIKDNHILIKGDGCQ